MKTHIRTAVSLFLVLTVITGVLYPMVVTGIVHTYLRQEANGSLIVQNGQPVGSALIGQPFDDPKYFWGRPSATGPFPYNAAASSGSNLGPTNDVLLKAVQDRVSALKAADSDNSAPVPIDLVTASGSGLDPHISPAAAEYQVHRVAKVRGLDEQRVRDLVTSITERRQLGILGEDRVNVLRLNLAMDELH